MDPNTDYINTLFNSFKSNINSTITTGKYSSVINPIATNATLFEENGDFVVSIDTSFNNRVHINGDVVLNSRLILNNPNTLFINGILYGGTSNLLTVFADLSVNGNLKVNSLATLNDRLFVNKDVSLSSRLFLNDSSIFINGALMQNLSNFQGDVSINNGLKVFGDSMFYGNNIFIGDVNTNSNLFANNAEIYKNLKVNGVLMPIGVLNAGNSVILGQPAYITDPSDTNIYLDVSGIVTFRNTVTPFRLIDDSVLFSNSPPIDYSSGFGKYWIQSPQSGIVGIDWRKIAMSSNGQLQSAVGYGSGIFVSMNHGINWNKAETPDFSNNWTSISISANGRIQTAVTDNGGVYLSVEYGTNWTLVPQQNMINLNYSDVAVSATGQYQTLVVNGGSIYVSNNYGKNWVQITQQNAQNLNWCAIKMSSSGQYQTVLSNPGTVFNSNNFGKTWSLNSYAPYASWARAAISADGKYQTITNYIPGTMYVSIDYGVNWNKNDLSLNNNSNCIDIAITANGKNQIACSYDNDFYVSTLYGANGTWYKINQPNPINKKYNSIAMSADGQYLTVVTYQGSIYYSITPYINMAINNDINVYGDSLLYNRLSVVGKSILTSDVSMNSGLSVSNSVVINSSLLVGNDVSFNSKLFVGGDVSFNNRLSVQGDASFNGRITGNSDVSFNSRLSIWGDASFNGRITGNSDVSFNNRLSVQGDVSFNGRITGNSDVSFNSRLSVGGDASFNRRITGNGDVSFNSRLSVQGDASFNGRITGNGDVSLKSRLSLTGDDSFNGCLL